MRAEREHDADSSELRALSLDEAKTHPLRHRWLKYRLSAAKVYQSPAGHCFTDHLDHVEEMSPEVDEGALTFWLERYLGQQLSSNHKRNAEHVALATQLLSLFSSPKSRSLQGKRVLDVGAGTGMFLAEMRKLGAEVEGIELADASVVYARRYGLTLHKHHLGSDFWRTQRASFDLVTLWDVLEHVDLPGRTLQQAGELLKPGGLLVIDTPSRDGAFHRLGDLSYRLSAGRYPTLLDLMYSSHAFGHKQILALHELRELIERAGLTLQTLDRIHDLALPTQNYLQMLSRSQSIDWLTPIARLAMQTIRPWNKARAIARKPAT